MAVNNFKFQGNVFIIQELDSDVEEQALWPRLKKAKWVMFQEAPRPESPYSSGSSMVSATENALAAAPSRWMQRQSPSKVICVEFSHFTAALWDGNRSFES